MKLINFPVFLIEYNQSKSNQWESYYVRAEKFKFIFQNGIIDNNIENLQNSISDTDYIYNMIYYEFEKASNFMNAKLLEIQNSIYNQLKDINIMKGRIDQSNNENYANDIQSQFQKTSQYIKQNDNQDIFKNNEISKRKISEIRDDSNSFLISYNEENILKRSETSSKINELKSDSNNNRRARVSFSDHTSTMPRISNTTNSGIGYDNENLNTLHPSSSHDNFFEVNNIQHQNQQLPNEKTNKPKVRRHSYHSSMSDPNVQKEFWKENYNLIDKENLNLCLLEKYAFCHRRLLETIVKAIELTHHKNPNFFISSSAELNYSTPSLMPIQVTDANIGSINIDDKININNNINNENKNILNNNINVNNKSIADSITSSSTAVATSTMTTINTNSSAIETANLTSPTASTKTNKKHSAKSILIRKIKDEIWPLLWLSKKIVNDCLLRQSKIYNEIRYSKQFYLMKNTENNTNSIYNNIEGNSSNSSLQYLLENENNNNNGEVADGKEKNVDDKSFVRKSIKYWVHPDYVTEVKSIILRHLPIYIFGNSDVENPKNPAISSVYYDNNQLELYHHRLHKTNLAIAFRYRWYGELLHEDNDKNNYYTPDGNRSEVFAERKTHKEDWTGDKSVKERFSIDPQKINMYNKGKYTINTNDNICNKRKSIQISRNSMSSKRSIPSMSRKSTEENRNESIKTDSFALSTTSSANTAFSSSSSTITTAVQPQPTQQTNTNPLIPITPVISDYQTNMSNTSNVNNVSDINNINTKVEDDGEEYCRNNEILMEKLKLSSEIQQVILEKRLRPTMRTFYNRTAFQLPDDQRVRISLDTELTFIREDLKAKKNEWKRHDVGINWPFKHLSDKEKYHFPYAVLEVKLQTQFGQEPPQWINELTTSYLVEPVPKFSKFMHGCAMLIPEKVKINPYWFYRMYDTEFNLRSPLNKATLRETTMCTVKMPWNMNTINNNFEIISPTLRRCISSRSSRIQRPTRREPKLSLANERMFLKYFKIGILVCNVSTIMYYFGDSIIGISYTFAGLLFILFGNTVYNWREKRIQHNPKMYPLDYQPGIYTLVCVLVLLFIFNLFNVYKGRYSTSSPAKLKHMLSNNVISSVQ